MAARIAVEQYDNIEVLYCDTLAYEHPDNVRFLHDVERWVGQTIQVLKNPDYKDIYDVFEKTRYLVGPKGARCTTELKKVVRKRYQRVDDMHIFGFTVEEGVRIARFHAENPEINARFPLFEQGLTKADCHRIVREAGIQIPAMYRLGYKNNNCIGCVKGGMGYWNKIRRDFPEIFQRMSVQERKLNVSILSKTVRGERVRVFLDELDPRAGRLEEEPDIECGVLCATGA